MACTLELNDGNNYQGVISAIICVITVLILANLVTFQNSLQLSPTWSSQVKKNIKVYDRCELKSLRTMVNHNPGILKLNLSTVFRVRKLKLQRKSRKGHHGGVGRIKVPSNGVNINNNISVAPIDYLNLTERVNYHHLGLINVRSIKSKDQALLNYALEHKLDVIIITETWVDGQ